VDVGRIEATLSARFDSDPFERYDRALRDAHQESTRPVEATLRGDYDAGGFSKFDRELNQAQSAARRGATAKLDARANTTQMDRYKRSLSDVDGTTRRTSTSTAGLKSSFTGLAANARMLAGGAAIAGVALSARQMYLEMSEAEAVGAQLDAVLRSTGGAAGVTARQVEALSLAVGNKAALDDEAVMSGANLLLTFTKIRNEAGKGNAIFDKAVKITADVSRSFGKDLNSSAIMVGKALNDPIAGMTALSRVGVQFTDQQKDQITALMESGDQLGAQKVILKELETQVGGSAEAYGKTLPGAVDRARNAFNNLMENLGGKLSPAVNAVANVLTDVFSGKAFQGGGTLDRIYSPLIDGAKQLWTAIEPVFGQLKDAFNDVFGGKGGRQYVQDLRGITKAISAVMGVMASVVRRAVPGIVQAFRGILLVVRGVVRIVGGILRGDWGRAWDGAKDVVSGALLAIWGAVRAATAPLREGLARLFRPIAALFRSAWNTAKAAVSSGVRSVISVIRGAVSGAKSAATAVGRGVVTAFRVVRDVPKLVRDAVGDAISAVRGLVGAAASAGASVGRAVISGIGSGLSAAGSFIANIGSQIASWINASTPFGDTIKIGPVSVALPALAKGGKVGPSMRGAQMFIAGEGGKDEWVISQEGDRGKNIGWAVEALRTLTGRDVAFFKGGGKPGGDKSVRRSVGKLQRVAGKSWGTYVQRSLTNIQRLDRGYGQLDRQLNFTEEEFLITGDDGSVTIDQAAVNRRLEELGKLRSARQRIFNAVLDLIRWIRRTQLPLRKAIAALDRAGRGKGKRGAKRRQKYREQARSYRQGFYDMADALPDLMLDLEDNRLDLEELDNERSALDPTVLAGQTRPGDGTGSSPEGVAELAAQQVAELLGNRSDLFSGFGSNFLSRGTARTGLTDMAGLRYFGGGQVSGGGVLAGAGGGSYGGTVPLDTPGATTAGGVTITNNYAAPPEDPHTWSQSLAWELRTAVS
jgi:hypothetical protein